MSTHSAAEIAQAVAEATGEAIDAIEPVAGGDINDAYRATTRDGDRVFVKTSSTAQHGAFSAEAAGLEWLGAPAALRVPGVLGIADPADGVRLLALEWIDSGSLSAEGEEALGRGLAAVHAAGAPSFGATPTRERDGYDRQPMRFNELSLPNDPHDSWARFYGHCRVLPLAHAAADRGRLSIDALPAFERLTERLPDLAGPDEPPARIHGDLWSGNVMATAGGEPVLIDPVAHGGHRELDLALLRLFGGPGERCYAAYEEAAPLADGHEQRVVLWQVAMILLHAVLLGGSYGERARQMAARYL